MKKIDFWVMSILFGLFQTNLNSQNYAVETNKSEIQDRLTSSHFDIDGFAKEILYKIYSKYDVLSFKDLLLDWFNIFDSAEAKCDWIRKVAFEQEEFLSTQILRRKLSYHKESREKFLVASNIINKLKELSSKYWEIEKNACEQVAKLGDEVMAIINSIPEELQ